jgi:hypothetical protein
VSEEQEAFFSASYSNWRVVQGRQVVQVIMEVPIEASHHAYNVLGGMPNPATTKFFAIARLDPEKVKA